MSKSKKSKRKMSKKQRRAVGAWLREAADLLGLRDLTICVDHTPPDPGAWGQCYPTWTQPEVVIAVDAELLAMDDTKIKQVLVHELVHAHHGDLKHDLLTAVDSLPQIHQDWITQVGVKDVERMVDNLARVIVEKVDLPSVEAVLS